jgi:hypothetical protein
MIGYLNLVKFSSKSGRTYEQYGTPSAILSMDGFFSLFSWKTKALMATMYKSPRFLVSLEWGI